MKKVILSTLIIILGLGLLIYPKASELYQNFKQDKILSDWEESLLNIGTGEDEEDMSNQKNYKDGEVQGTLTIDKIDLKLPVLTNATNENLLISLASIKNTGKPGEVGNYAIAGHRNRTYGRNFNRLEEVDVDDLISFTDKEDRYDYRVTEKLYVTPYDTWVLDSKDDEEITLITCHPMINPTHRLVIKGKIEK